MNTFLIASAFIIIGCLGLSTAVMAETKALAPVAVQKNVQNKGGVASEISVSIVPAVPAVSAVSTFSARDYYFQSWNCLTDL